MPRFLRLPESCCWAAAGLIALPTNWPPSSEATARGVINARALENIYYATVNGWVLKMVLDSLVVVESVAPTGRRWRMRIIGTRPSFMRIST
ncbi:MAG: hypothetical protein M2R45_02795 [Verrucomicrobia subdivision 3 bacterium]|nr:hypothetical protein [Limisphaerales bacterium]MCS1414347.1 hypothetical protein [Limisphaerales bacterium]